MFFDWYDVLSWHKEKTLSLHLNRFISLGHDCSGLGLGFGCFGLGLDLCGLGLGLGHMFVALALALYFVALLKSFQMAPARPSENFMKFAPDVGQTFR